MAIFFSSKTLSNLHGYASSSPSLENYGRIRNFIARSAKFRFPFIFIEINILKYFFKIIVKKYEQKLFLDAVIYDFIADRLADKDWLFNG